MKCKNKTLYVFLLMIIFFSLASKDVMPTSISKKTKSGIKKIESMQKKTVSDIKEDSEVKKVNIEEEDIDNIIDEAISSLNIIQRIIKNF